ncbi:MAG: sulfatase-like hydrolase/transferase, partial [Planctomycetaceae bacterium]
MNIRCMLKHLPESLSVILCCVILCSTSSGQQRPNILLIAVDDLNDWVSCLGGHPQGHTPHMDQLAQQGTLFSNAHCQAPICNPSRTSVMYGMRPHRTGVYMNAPL